MATIYYASGSVSSNAIANKFLVADEVALATSLAEQRLAKLVQIRYNLFNVPQGLANIGTSTEVELGGILALIDMDAVGVYPIGHEGSLKIVPQSSWSVGAIKMGGTANMTVPVCQTVIDIMGDVFIPADSVYLNGIYSGDAAGNFGGENIVTQVELFYEIKKVSSGDLYSATVMFAE